MRPDAVSGWGCVRDTEGTVRALLAAAIAVPVLLFAVIWTTTLGGWLQSFVPGARVRWSNAYAELNPMEARGWRLGSDRARVELANAMVEGDPPRGLAVDGPRLHPAGTLAHLRYESFDEHGQPVETWRVRALLPALGLGYVGGGAELDPGWGGCPEECRAAIGAPAPGAPGFGGPPALTESAALERTGVAGIATEWVLRMPVGRGFDLEPISLVTQDVRDPEPATRTASTRTIDGRRVHEPARLRVTLEDACRGRAWIGTVTRLDVHPFAIIAIPSGFRRIRWLQLDGCGPLPPLSPATALASDQPVERT